MAYTTLPVAGGIPIASVYDPATNTFPGLQGSPVKNVDSFVNTSAPIVSGDQLQVAIMNGKGFVATTGMLATLTNGNLVMGLSVFNPLAGGKSLFIYSIKFSTVTVGGLTLHYNLTTTDPAFATVITPLNMKPLAGSSTASCTCPINSATVGIAVTGAQQDVMINPTAGTFEFLTAPSGILLPNGVANGVVVYGTVATAAQNWSATIRWIEF